MYKGKKKPGLSDNKELSNVNLSLWKWDNDWRRKEMQKKFSMKRSRCHCQFSIRHFFIGPLKWNTNHIRGHNVRSGQFMPGQVKRSGQDSTDLHLGWLAELDSAIATGIVVRLVAMWLKSFEVRVVQWRMNVENILVHLAFKLIEVSVCWHCDALVVAEVGLLVPRAKTVLGTNNQIVVFANNAYFAWVQILWEGELHGDKFLVLADNRVKVQLMGAYTLLCQRYFDDQLVFAYHVRG